MLNKPSAIRFTVLMVGVALLPVFASLFPRDETKMVVPDDDSAFVGREIMRKIPAGSNIRFAKRIMQRNGFVFNKQTGSTLEFEKEESFGPDHWGTVWAATISLKHGTVSGAKVWIGPSD